MSVSIPEKEVRGGQCFHRIGHRLPPKRRSLPGFCLVKLEGQLFHFLGNVLSTVKTVKWCIRDAFPVDVQACAERKASSVLSRWGTEETVVSLVHSFRWRGDLVLS